MNTPTPEYELWAWFLDCVDIALERGEFAAAWKRARARLLPQAASFWRKPPLYGVAHPDEDLRLYFSKELLWARLREEGDEEACDFLQGTLEEYIRLNREAYERAVAEGEV